MFVRVGLNVGPLCYPTVMVEPLSLWIRPCAVCASPRSPTQKHVFFEGLDVESLHTQVPPAMAQGSAAPAPDAGWTKRQFSMMWAPMPTKYTFKQDKFVASPIPETATERDSSFMPLTGIHEHL